MRFSALDSKFQTLAFNDNETPGTKNAKVALKVAADGRYCVVVREKSSKPANFDLMTIHLNGRRGEQLKPVRPPDAEKCVVDVRKAADACGDGTFHPSNGDGRMRSPTLRANLPAVSTDHSRRRRETDPDSRKLRGGDQALKGREKVVSMRHVEANPVIAHEDLSVSLAKLDRGDGFPVPEFFMRSTTHWSTRPARAAGQPAPPFRAPP